MVVPLAFAAGVYVRSPVGEIAGCVENNGLLLLVTMKFTAWPDSFVAPRLMAVAQPTTVCAPASSSTV
jgi:hypothetical protein